MESKKLQQLQQANLHLAPQVMPQKRALPPFAPSPGDYRTPRSPGFQNQLKYHNISSNIAQINLTATRNQNLPSSQLPAMDTTACSHTHLKHSVQNIYQPLPNEKLYQCPNNDRTVQLTPSRSHYNSLIHSHPHPIQSLQQQYQQLQNAKIQQQIQTQNEALVQQQRTFALRQQLNPPIPQSHFHIQSPTIVQPQLQQPSLQQNAQRNVPPSTLNLSTQFQPALDPFKITNLEMRNPLYIQDIHSELLLQSQKSQSQAIYQQNKQIQQQILKGNMETMTPVEHTPVYIQQNHPGHVVNQACQTQLSGTIGTPFNPIEENKNSLHQSLDRKKNSITMQTLKSPITKRPASSLVTISGWLYKQGSDGLKVWRKRWFVLSEYCLYYYKGPEEGKILGSLLLPSYQVAACSIEDKIYRKYAFKCEHTNMRTYWLAAENAETMGKWIRALMAAAMMQGSNESSDHTSQPSVSSFNHSGENSDSGIHTFQSHQSKISLTQGSGTPASDSGGIQPLYANAPPKPRRVNDGGYSSPSPENSIEQRFDTINDSRQYQSSSQHSNQNLMKSQTKQMLQPSHHQAIYDNTTGNVISTLQMEQSGSENQKHFDNAISHPIFGQSSDLEPHISITPQRFEPDIYDERELHIQRSINQKYGVQMNSMLGINYTNSERRTPDAYGRSKLGQAKTFSDYEDIYNLNQHQSIQRGHQTDLTEYRRPLSPPSYNSSKHGPTITSSYGANQLETGVGKNISIKNRSVKPAAIARPHSADFLEYEARADFQKSLKMDQIHSRRPKSSLDINRNQDSYYYSEASYAEKMRQSALYLQKPSNVSQIYSSCSPYGGQSSAYAIGPNYFAHENQYYKLKKNEMNTEGNRQESLGTIHKSNLKDQRIQYNEQFLRSASARLPRKDDDSIIKEGERKREESMKRLLEWKQRMLQSPLTRKSAQQSTTSMSKLINSSKMMSPLSIQRSRSDSHANDGYNSYSSDDEDGPEYSPTGRSSSTLTSSNVTETSTITTSLCSRKSTQSIKNISNLSTSLLSNKTYVPVYVQKTLHDSALKIQNSNIISQSEFNVKQIPKLSSENVTDSFCENTILVLPKTDNDIKVIELQADAEERTSNIGSDNIDKCIDNTYEYTDDDLNEALSLELDIEKSEIEQLFENELKSNNPNKLESIENHYLPMTSKKSILSATNSSLEQLSVDDCEENPYVEMMKNIDESKSNYEIVCISVKLKGEPVYMELSHVDGKVECCNELLGDGKTSDISTITKSTSKRLDSNKKKQKKNLERISKRKDLPDILKPSQNSLLISDSSDADDESSKNVDGTKIRSRFRFSLSDTFRPASYYLGASTPLTNFTESSDSEIVSPPPIPLSPPPLEELNSEEMFLSENYNTVKRRDEFNLSFDRIPKVQSSITSLGSVKTEGLKPSRLSLPDQFSKLPLFKTHALKTDDKTLSESNFSFHTDNSSNTSSDLDLYKKRKNSSTSFIDSMYPSNSSLPHKFQTTDSETDSVELRQQQGPDSDLERNRSRRPLSEESISEIESMSEHFEEMMQSTDLDSYLSRLQTSDLYLYHSSHNNWISDSITNFIKPPEVFRNAGDDKYYGNINFISSSDSLQKIGNDISSELKCCELHLSKNLSQLKQQNLSLHDAQCESDDLINFGTTTSTADLPKSVTLSSVDMDQTSFCTAYDLTQTSPFHCRNNSSISDQSAPYYYSDIAPRSSSNEDISQTLNNEKYVNLKRPGFFQINNPINNNCNSVEKAATSLNEGRSIAGEILSVAENDKLIENKMLFKIEYPIEKTLSNNLKLKKLNHDAVHENAMEYPSLGLTTSMLAKQTNYSSLSSQKISNVEPKIEPCTINSSKLSDVTAGERLWDEDTIWRESLRRVSQRHARSLDDLDQIMSGSSESNIGLEFDKYWKIEKTPDSKQMLAKISRDVTYVNDNILPGARSSYGSRRINSSEWNNKVKNENENDVYVQLAVDDSYTDVYEMASNILKKSAEIDREVIRQWDSMSSGLMKSTGGTAKITKLGDKAALGAIHIDNGHIISTTDTLSEHISTNIVNLNNSYRAT